MCCIFKESCSLEEFSDRPNNQAPFYQRWNALEELGAIQTIINGDTLNLRLLSQNGNSKPRKLVDISPDCQCIFEGDQDLFDPLIFRTAKS